MVNSKAVGKESVQRVSSWVPSLAGRQETGLLVGNAHQSREAHKAGCIPGIGFGDCDMFFKGNVEWGGVFGTLASLETNIQSKPYNCMLPCRFHVDLF